VQVCSTVEESPVGEAAVQALAPAGPTSALTEPPRSGRRPCETTSSGCSPPKPPHTCRG